MTNLIWNFFEAVQERWPDAWDVNANGNMLNRTNGFDGLMRYFRHAYRYISSPGKVATAGQFKALLDKSELEDDDFNPQNFIPGSSGGFGVSASSHRRDRRFFDLRKARHMSDEDDIPQGLNREQWAGILVELNKREAANQKRSETMKAKAAAKKAERLALPPVDLDEAWRRHADTCLIPHTPGCNGMVS